MTDIIERLRELQWKAAACACTSISVHVSELERPAKEIERLRTMLRECIPKLMGDDYDYSETRICRECGYYSGHGEDCLVKRIEEVLNNG